MSGLRRSRKSSPPGRRKRGRRASPGRRLEVRPTIVLLNGKILTMDRAVPSAEAIALNGDRIAAIGTVAEISDLAGPRTGVLDLRGATVLPGFIDCHIHLIEYGLGMKNLDLRAAVSIKQLKERVSARARDASFWILGRGWDQEKLAEGRYPTRQDLDEASPHKPVLLRRVCGHICVVNSLALQSAGIGAATPDPESGIIDRDPSGEPTGILRERAVDLVERIIPDPDSNEYETATLAACRKAVEAGLTSVHCILSSEKELRALLNLRMKGLLPLRFYVFVPPELMRLAIELGLRTGFGDEWVRLGGVKIFTDGSLGARTAALQDPYHDDHANRGVTIYNQDDLDSLLLEAQRADMQAAVHAIGDRAITMAIESLRKAKAPENGKDLRHRIEHASVLNPNLIKAMKDSDLIASIQPHFVVSDFWVSQRLGEERTRFTYAVRSLLKAGLMTVAGSDCPVEPLAPLSGIAAAVNRSDIEEAVGILEAVALYTRNAAFASFDEDVKGTITPGKYADLVIIDRDIRKIRPSEFESAKVLMTMVDGKIVYSSGELTKHK